MRGGLSLLASVLSLVSLPAVLRAQGRIQGTATLSITVYDASPAAPPLRIRLAKEWPRFKQQRRTSSVQKELETTVDTLFNSLADLDELFAAGKVAETQHWRERLDLKARLTATLKKASPLLLESYATRHTSSR